VGQGVAGGSAREVNEAGLLHPAGRTQSRFGLATFNVLCLLICFFTLRLVLFFRFKPEPSVSGLDVMKAFLIGLHLDLFVALVLTLPLAAWLAVIPNDSFRSRWHRVLLRTVFLFFWIVQIFLLFAEYYFFEEFKSRFNTVAVDYLFYPYEVFVNIWQTYSVAAVILACAGLAAVLLVASQIFLKHIWETPPSVKSRLLHLGATLALIVFLGCAISPGETHFSRERVVNEIANNGQRAFVNAALTRHLDFAAFYRTLPPAEAFERARRLLAEPKAHFEGGPNPILRSIDGDPGRPRLNVVIFLEESLGSEFWGCLGRTNSLTPEMDRLAAEEGILFSNLYASGNRTVRGFEGVLSSFPPLPGDSIVKRDQSQNVETIARVLKRDGYQTVFLYGGRGVFDGMRSFALNNGYDRFVEQKHFDRPTFKTIWGVCDEDTFQRAIEEFRTLSATDKPFCGTILSVSNHKPFTYPPGRIPDNPEERKRENAVKYSDYALGQFFRAARKEPFYTNTIFVVVADHGARVYGSQSIPIHSYEIPLLIAGPAVVRKPSKVASLGCSLDVAPTILGLLGRPYESVFFGLNLLNAPPEEGRALLNHNRDIGLFRQDHLVVLGINKTVEYYHGNPKVESIRRVSQPDALDVELEKDATSLFQMADEAYTHGRYNVR